MRVLLAENNPANGLIAKSILERENCSVTLVTDGANAILKLQSVAHDILLLDIVMPVMDGFQTVQYLQNHSSRPKLILALSAYDTPEDVQLYRIAGFDGVIAKPLRPGDLKAAMSAHDIKQMTSTIGVAANVQDAESRPLLDPTILRDGAGQTDDVTRARILKSYRSGLSDALKDLSRSLPGRLRDDPDANTAFQKSLHALRSSSLTIGMDRAPFLAKILRDIQTDQVLDGVAFLLHTLRDSLPALEDELRQVRQSLIASR